MLYIQMFLFFAVFCELGSETPEWFYEYQPQSTQILLLHLTCLMQRPAVEFVFVSSEVGGVGWGVSGCSLKNVEGELLQNRGNYRQASCMSSLQT